MILTFTTTLKLNTHINKLVNDVKNIITILKKADSVLFFDKKCPSIVETRWINIYDVLEFIIDFKDNALTLLALEKFEVNIDELEQFLDLVSPLKYLVEKMESNYSICCVGIYINDFVVHYRHTDFNLITDIFQELYTVLIARLKSNNFGLVISAYFLLAGRRAHFSMKNANSISLYDPYEKVYKYPYLMDID